MEAQENHMRNKLKSGKNLKTYKLILSLNKLVIRNGRRRKKG